MAERAGFEPAVRLKPYARFPSVYLKPLGHLSLKESGSTKSTRSKE